MNFDYDVQVIHSLFDLFVNILGTEKLRCCSANAECDYIFRIQCTVIYVLISSLNTYLIIADTFEIYASDTTKM